MCAETADADAFRERLAEQLGGIRALALSVDGVLNTVREPAAESVAMGEIAAEHYLVRALRTAAANLFTLMGWVSSDWEQAAAAAEQLELQFAQMALQQTSP